MTSDELFEVAYNAHEGAEAAAMVALIGSLRTASIDALACIVDPQWNWQSRSWMSDAIIDHASDVLDEKLEALLV